MNIDKIVLGLLLFLSSFYYDDEKVPTSTKVGVKKVKVDSSSKLDVNLKASGGQAIWITPLL